MKLSRSLFTVLGAGFLLSASGLVAGDFSETWSVSCTAKCTCSSADGSASIPLNASGATKEDAAQNAKAQCDRFAGMAGASPDACQVTDLNCR